jgi:conjugative relaxase-like TrwC/TraI family protein
VTVRVTSLKGAVAGQYYTRELPDYYLNGHEPPGQWWGKGADRLGLEGRLNAEVFHSVLSGVDPDTGEQLGRRFGERSVRGYDATFSAPKSVSVLWALGDETIQSEVVEAHEGAVESVLGWVEEHAHTRLRRNGHVIHVDAGGVIVGIFRQHTSRRLDPQLHSHAVIANRVPAPDGRWLALDARSLMVDQRTLSALYHAALRSELTRRLRVRWQQVENGIAEIDGIPEAVCDEFSQRTQDLQKRLDVKRQRFVETMGREPSQREEWSLEREAVLDSRPGKPDQPTMTELREVWLDRTRRLGLDPDRLLHKTIGRRIGTRLFDRFADQRQVDTALASLVEGQSSWRPAELVRELAAATPTTTKDPADQLARRINDLTDRMVLEGCVDISKPIPAGVELRRDGRPVTEPAVNRALTTQTILDEEQQVISWAQTATKSTRLPALHRYIKEQAPELTTGQQEAVAAVIGPGRLELIVGPAGTGKTTALRTATNLLNRAGKPIFGVAPTAAAAQVLADETGMTADTLDKLLYEHHQPGRPPHPAYDLAADTTIILDEAGTASIPNLAQLARLAQEKRWRVVMVGDPQQFNAVGRGGMFTHLTQTHDPVQLDEVHRFVHEWERTASLRLRTGDPTILNEYDRHGRLHGGTLETMETRIIAAWKQARTQGQTVALMAHSSETVDRLNKSAQQTRIMAGDIDLSRPWLKSTSGLVFEGDEVVTRHNDRRLTTEHGITVKNRDHWTVTHIHPDNSLSVTGPSGTVRLPAVYAREHVELGYAQTSHATQGRTVDTALLLVDTPTDSRNIYTSLTRGRHSNHAYIALTDNETPQDILTQAITRDWADQPAHARRNQLTSQEQRPPELEVEPEDNQRMAELQQAIERARIRRQEIEQARSLGLSLW